VDLVTSRKVAESALSYLSGEYGYSAGQLQGMLETSTTASNSSKLSEKIYITATAPNPDHAIAIANAVTNAFVDEMRSLTGGNTVQVLDSANYAKWSNKKSKLAFRLLGAFIGAFIPMFIIFMKEILSDEVYHIEDAGCDGELEILAVIPDFDNN
jgi:capsular polysaccharide biosynthesis protein